MAYSWLGNKNFEAAKAENCIMYLKSKIGNQNMLQKCGEMKYQKTHEHKHTKVRIFDNTCDLGAWSSSVPQASKGLDVNMFGLSFCDQNLNIQTERCKDDQTEMKVEILIKMQKLKVPFFLFL